MNAYTRCGSCFPQSSDIEREILQRVCYCAAKRQFSFLHRKSCDVTDKHELKTLGTYF